MDKLARLADNLKRLNGGSVYNIPIITAKVKSIEGESCTVDVDGLLLTDVRLKATINESGNSVIVQPKKGSYVLLGSLSGDLKDLTVLKIDEIEKIIYKQDGLEITVDATDGKVSVKNNAVSLKGLFQSLTDLLKQFKVMTPSGVSTALVPDTLAAVVQFEADFKQLLK